MCTNRKQRSEIKSGEVNTWTSNIMMVLQSSEASIFQLQNPTHIIMNTISLKHNALKFGKIERATKILFRLLHWIATQSKERLQYKQELCKQNLKSKLGFWIGLGHSKSSEVLISHCIRNLIGKYNQEKTSLNENVDCTNSKLCMDDGNKRATFQNTYYTTQ